MSPWSTTKTREALWRIASRLWTSSTETLANACVNNYLEWLPRWQGNWVCGNVGFELSCFDKRRRLVCLLIYEEQRMCLSRWSRVSLHVEQQFVDNTTADSFLPMWHGILVKLPSARFKKMSPAIRTMTEIQRKPAFFLCLLVHSQHDSVELNCS